MAWNRSLQLLVEPVSPQRGAAALKAVTISGHTFFADLVLRITLPVAERIVGGGSFRVLRHVHLKKGLSHRDKPDPASKPNLLVADKFSDRKMEPNMAWPREGFYNYDDFRINWNRQQK